MRHIKIIVRFTSTFRYALCLFIFSAAVWSRPLLKFPSEQTRDRGELLDHFRKIITEHGKICESLRHDRPPELN